MDDVNGTEGLSKPTQADGGHDQLRISFAAGRPAGGTPRPPAAADWASRPALLASTAGRGGRAWTSRAPAVNVSPRPTVEAGLRKKRRGATDDAPFRTVAFRDRRTRRLREHGRGGRVRFRDRPACLGARRGQKAPHGERIQFALGVFACQRERPGIGVHDEPRQSVALSEAGHLRLQSGRIHAY